MTQRLHFIERLGLVLVALATLATLWLGRVDVTWGVLIGWLLGVVNFYALRRLMGGIMQAGNPPRQIALTLLLLVKFGLLGLVLYLVLTHFPIDPLSMLVGVSLVVVAIFIEGARSVLAAGGATGEIDQTPTDRPRTD